MCTQLLLFLLYRLFTHCRARKRMPSTPSRRTILATTVQLGIDDPDLLDIPPPMSYEAWSVGDEDRDLLLNLRCGATGHIAEVQITLRPLLAVKTFGGHAAYALARVHHLNDPEIFRHEGALSTRVLTALRAGLIRELKCNGVVELARHQSGLFDACRSPTCLLDCLVLAGCDWPADQPMTALLEAVQAVGPQLKELRASSMGAADGRLPPSFFERSPNLQLLLLRDVGLNGPLPESLGALTHARCIRLWGNRLSGSIPTTIGRCAALQDLQLYDNVLTGPIPEALGECTDRPAPS